jgi:hypothetical protein
VLDAFLDTILGVGAGSVAIVNSDMALTVGGSGCKRRGKGALGTLRGSFQ